MLPVGALERMNDKVQRLRRDLTEAIAQPNWPPGYRVRTFTANDAATVYQLLDVGYANVRKPHITRHDALEIPAFCRATSLAA